MKLKDLKQRGAFVANAPVKKEITWTRTDAEGNETSDTFDIWVKKHSFGSYERALGTDPDDPERSRNAAMVAATVLLGDNADEPLSYAEAFSLEPSLALLFVKAITEVNGASSAAPKA